MINCKNCGAKNDEKANYCSSCGAKFGHSKSKKKKVADSVNNQNSKSLKISYKGMSIIAIILGTLVIINLFFSGVFDSPKVITNNKIQQNVQNNPHAGVDMSKLQQLNDMEKQLKANPNNHELLLQVAHLYNDSGFKDKAIERYNLYLKTHPEVADVWVDLGVCYFEKQNFNDALRCMNKGIELEPNHQIGHFNIGIVNMSMNKIDEAKKWWKKAYEINPNAPIAARAKELIDKN